MRAYLCTAAAFLAAFAAGNARAQGADASKGGSVTVSAPNPNPDTSATPDWGLRRTHTIAELELGFIALPNAPISQNERGGSLPLGTTIGHGDATASVGMHLLYRGGASWAIGAGALFCPNPTSDTTTVLGITSTHSRDYLWMGGEIRYIPIHSKTIEAWVGGTVGGVVVADRFTTATTSVPSDLGTSQVTVRSEGLALGVQLGGDWDITENLVLGLALRFDGWILPANIEQQCTPTGECPSLSGPVAEVEFGIRLGYRIPL